MGHGRECKSAPCVLGSHTAASQQKTPCPLTQSTLSFKPTKVARSSTIVSLTVTTPCLMSLSAARLEHSPLDAIACEIGTGRT